MNSSTVMNVTLAYSSILLAEEMFSYSRKGTACIKSRSDKTAFSFRIITGHFYFWAKLIASHRISFVFPRPGAIVKNL